MPCPSEIATKNRSHLSFESSSRRGVVCLSEQGSRSGKKVSPRQEIVGTHSYALVQVRKSSLSKIEVLS